MNVRIQADVRGVDVDITVSHGYTETYSGPYNKAAANRELTEAVQRVRAALELDDE
jgi:hypothetical protein